MPQFDFFCFRTQVFWFIIAIIAAHLLIVLVGLAELAEALKIRQKISEYYKAELIKKINLRDYFLKEYFKQ